MNEDEGPWVCLPSKHHPKDVYYFNVLTGVSTWEKPENLRKSSETPSASAASSSSQSEHNAGYVVESLSPKSSPRRPPGRSDDTAAAATTASENNEKKKGIFCQKGNSFRFLKNKHIVRDFPYKVSDRSTKSSEHYDSNVSKGKERNDVVAKYFPPSRPFNQGSRRREDSRLVANPNSRPSAISSYHNTKSTSYSSTYNSELSSSVSCASPMYGSASLRLENLKSKLAKERLERQTPQVPQADFHNQRGKEKSALFFKERNASFSSSRNQSHPYVPYVSSSRTANVPSSSSFSRQFKDNFCRDAVREIDFSVALDEKYKRTGFTRDYNHKNSKKVEIDLTEPTTAKRHEYMLPSNSYLPKCKSTEIIPSCNRGDSLVREGLSELSPEVSINFDRPTIFRDRVAVPVSKSNALICSEYKNPPLNHGCQRNNLIENKKSFVELRNNSSSGNLSKTPAADRLVNLRSQLQKRIIPVNSVYLRESNDSRSESWNRTVLSGDPIDRNSWKWDKQIIVHDYNHKRVEQSKEGTDTLSHLGALSKHSFSGIDEIQGNRSESNVPRKISWNGNPESSLQPYDQASGDKSSVSRNKIADVAKITKNHLLDYRSNVGSIPNITSSETSFEFIKPNQDTLLKLHRGSKKKIQDSKGGITKVCRRVQKQIRSVSPVLRRIPNTIVNKKKASEITQEMKILQPTKLLEEVTDSDEMMDWEPIEPEKIVLHVEEMRKDGSLQTSATSGLTDLCNMEAPTSSKWFIVLDTNVLLSHLEFLEYLRDVKDYEYGMPILYIPWIVLQELDGLKSSNKNSSLKYYARRAVRFLQDNLECRHPRIRGQPKILAEKEDNQADDSILQCSLDLAKKSYNVLLLTNDRNLYNKAVVSGMMCCSAARLHEDLENRLKTSLSHGLDSSEIKNINDNEQEEKINFIFCQIKNCLKEVLEEVLKTEMILAYDRTWLTIVVKKPPWTLNDVLFCILKHWVAVFGLIFPSTARRLLEQIQAAFRICYQHSLTDVNNLLNMCELLISMISSLSYKQLADKALITIKEMRQTLEQLSVKSDDKPTSARSPSEKLCQKSSSAHNESSDSDSQSSVSDRSRRKSYSSEIMDSESDAGSGRNANDSDGDCISLVASSFCDNVLNKQLSESAVKEGQEIVHSYLNKIWGKVAVFCGMLSDLMGVEPCVPYEPPDPVPSAEMLHQNMLYFVKCVSGLLRCVERILSYPAGEMFENHPAILNFCSFIRDSFPALSHQETKSLPYYVYIYCTRSDTRQQLETGRKQFEQFEAVLNEAVTFFMKLNHSGPTVTPLM